MDEEFLQRAEGTRLRLEAEGMIATAKAIRELARDINCINSNLPSDLDGAAIKEWLERNDVPVPDDLPWWPEQGS